MKWRWILLGTVIGFLAISLFGINHTGATPPAADGGRVRKVQINITQYVWQVISNANGKVLCEVTIEHDRSPSNDEVLAACANLINVQVQPPAEEGTTAVPTATSYTQSQFLQIVRLNLLRVDHFVRSVTITMQKMTTDIELPDKLLAEPYVVLTAFEPEPDFQISAIHGKLNGSEFYCDVSRCRLLINRDSTLEFWAASTFGDESEHIKATIRVLTQTGGYSLTIDSISPIRIYADSCSQIWGNSVGIPPPDWAVFPSSPEYLHTDKKFYYLAGKLLHNEIVNAADCPGGGLLSDGSPNACGMDKASTEMIRWQNQYDTMIWATGRETGVPPTIAKVLFEIESQFWPANIRYYVFEFGLAQLNQYGADVALRWDNDLYKQVCNSLFYNCSLAYASQPASMQAILRGGLVRAINSDCPTCKNGIDFSKAVETVPMLARVLRANCSQAKFIFNQNNIKPSYIDAWKFTLVSYHSGYYCLQDAIQTTLSNGDPATWDKVSPNINPYCFGGADYVNEFWNALTTFSTNRIKPDLSPASVPLVKQVPTQIPTLTPTPVVAQSSIRVQAYVDKNKNGRFDDGEGVDNLQVTVAVNNTPSLSQKTVNGTAVFNMTGYGINSTAIVSLPTQFVAKSVQIQASGEALVVFQLQQSSIPPVLP